VSTELQREDRLPEPATALLLAIGLPLYVRAAAKAALRACARNAPTNTAAAETALE
jgi:hypothetical protein